MTTSPRMPWRASEPSAFSMHTGRVLASFRQGMTMLNSTSPPSPAPVGAPGAAVFAMFNAGQCAATAKADSSLQSRPVVVKMISTHARAYRHSRGA
jgi:hypothetical protein